MVILMRRHIKFFSFVCCLIFVTRFSLLHKKIEQILGLVLTKSYEFFESFHDFVLESVHTIFFGSTTRLSRDAGHSYLDRGVG